MRIFLLLPVLLLTGCAMFGAAPVKPKFPEVPKQLMEACPDLKQVEESAKFSDVLTVVAENYSQYHECRAKVEYWIEWYKLQKDIYNK